MQRTEVVVRAAIPMAVMNTLFWMAIRNESVSWLLILGLPLTAYWGGASVARRLQATWREIVLGFVGALAPLLLLEPGMIFDSVLLGGSGLLLLPLLSKAVRAADESVAIPTRSVMTYAAAALAGLMVIASRYMPLPMTVMWSFIFCYSCFLPVAVVAGALAIAGQSRIGAWVGAIGAAMLWISFGLFWLALPFLQSGNTVLSTILGR